MSDYKYVPTRYWRSMKLIEADVEYLENKATERELTEEEKIKLESGKSELPKYKKRIEESTWCTKCDCIIDDGKQEYPDLCCTCDTK